MAAFINSQANVQQKKGILKTVFILLAIVSVLLAGFLHKMLSPRVLSETELRLNGAIQFEKPRIVRDFQLLDQNNQPFTKENLKGKWSIVFFGFTHCPDICPTTMAKLNQVYKKLDSDVAEQTQVILVSLDPARDTPKKLKEYVSFFNADFVGVTGDFMEIMKFTRDTNIAFKKVVQGDDYTVDHSSNIVLFNPYGDYHGFFKAPHELAKLKLTFTSIVKTFD